MFFKKEEYINKHSIFMQTDSKYFRKITTKTCYWELYQFSFTFGTLYNEKNIQRVRTRRKQHKGKKC